MPLYDTNRLVSRFRRRGFPVFSVAVSSKRVFSLCRVLRFGSYSEWTLAEAIRAGATNRPRQATVQFVDSPAVLLAGRFPHEKPHGGAATAGGKRCWLQITNCRNEAIANYRRCSALCHRVWSARSGDRPSAGTLWPRSKTSAGCGRCAWRHHPADEKAITPRRPR